MTEVINFLLQQQTHFSKYHTLLTRRGNNLGQGKQSAAGYGKTELTASYSDGPIPLPPLPNKASSLESVFSLHTGTDGLLFHKSCTKDE